MFENIYSDDDSFNNTYDWRQYFSVNELQNVVEQIDRGDEPISNR